MRAAPPCRFCEQRCDDADARPWIVGLDGEAAHCDCLDEAQREREEGRDA